MSRGTRQLALTGLLRMTATLTATAVDYHPTGWSPCTRTPRGMDRDVLESSPCTLSDETFNPRVLGSNPSRLTTDPRSEWPFPELSEASGGRFDSHVDSHGKRIRYHVVASVEAVLDIGSLRYYESRVATRSSEGR